MLNVVIPMAGLGSRFANAGYVRAKPFIDVCGKPMIVRVLENLVYPDARYLLIAREEHLIHERGLVDQIREQWNVEFISINQVTEGAACTVLFARTWIDTRDPLVIANSDQIVDACFADYVDDCFKRKLDGSIMTFCDPFRDNKWSFARVDDCGIVREVREKDPISDIATVGIYMFSEGRNFVGAALDMVVRNDRVNQEFYVCPVYNYAIRNAMRIGIYPIEFSQMHGIGTPDDLSAYVQGIA